MKNKSLVIALVMCLLLIPIAASYGAYNNWGGTDRRRLLGRELPIDLIYSGTKRGGVSQIVSRVSKLVEANLAFAILELSGASKTFSMAAGEVGQEITLVKSEHSDQVLKIDLKIDASPTTATGWRSVTFGTAAGSCVTFAWPSDELGWIVRGGENITIGFTQ